MNETDIMPNDYYKSPLYKMGVYVIHCAKEKKSYIGSSDNIELRFSAHKASLKSNRHYNAAMQSDYNKHGCDAFKFAIYEITTDIIEARRLEAQLLSGMSAKGILYNRVGKRLQKGDFTKIRSFKKKLPEPINLTPEMVDKSNRVMRAN